MHCLPICEDACVVAFPCVVKREALRFTILCNYHHVTDSTNRTGDDEAGVTQRGPVPRCVCLRK